MALFEKKKEPMAAAQTEDRTPIDIVREMKSQGYSNNQVVEYLQKQGLKSEDIFDAINKAEAGPSAGPIETAMPPQFQQMPAQTAFMQSAPGFGISKEQVEEISESIVDERIEDIKKEFKKILDWKESAETRIVAIMQSLEDLSKNFDNLHTGVLGKIEEYDKGIVEVGTEIKALEKVFSKILPTLTENVSELSRITQKMKESPKSSAKK
jgi:DNA-binding transcriptional MerR regulator